MTYKVRFVNPGRHYLAHKDEYLKAIDEVLTRGDLIARGDLEDFEKNIAKLVGVRYAVGLNSATDALWFPLRILGVGPGDEVVTVSHTFVATIAAIVHTGATPILVDVRKDFLMDPDKLEKAITPRTKAIMPVHLNGRVCEMDKIIDIAKRHNLHIVEDAAQALGAEFGGKKAGSFGAAAAFSFYPFKVLGSFGDGGILTTNDDAMAEKTFLLRDHGNKTKTEFVMYGFNSRLDNLQAAILNVKLKYFPEWLDRRRQIADTYSEKLADVAGIELPPRSDENHHDIFQNFVLKAQKRDELAEYLKAQGVETLIKDPFALHHQPALGLSHFSLPYTEQLAKEVISLPLHPDLTDEEVDFVIEAVKGFYAQS